MNLSSKISWQYATYGTFMSAAVCSFKYPELSEVLSLWAAAPKGTKSCRIQGESVHPVHPSDRSSERPGPASERPESASERPGLASKRPGGDGQTCGRDVQIPPVFYRTLSPLGPLPCSL